MKKTLHYQHCYSIFAAAALIVLTLSGCKSNQIAAPKVQWLGNPAVYSESNRNGKDPQTGWVDVIGWVDAIEIGLQEDGTVVWRNKESKIE